LPSNGPVASAAKAAIDFAAFAARLKPRPFKADTNKADSNKEDSNKKDSN
jgi:hypothetical protein